MPKRKGTKVNQPASAYCCCTGLDLPSILRYFDSGNDQNRLENIFNIFKLRPAMLFFVRDGRAGGGCMCVCNICVILFRNIISASREFQKNRVHTAAAHPGLCCDISDRNPRYRRFAHIKKENRDKRTNKYGLQQTRGPAIDRVPPLTLLYAKL